MRVRPNIFLASSLLLTPAFLWLLPYMINSARYTGTDNMTRTAGLASLTVIIVGLIVIWTWLVRGSRVAGGIMAVIVWVWAFPVMILISPMSVKHIITHPLSDWSYLVLEAWHGVHFAQVFLGNTVFFLLMLVGLILPVKALLRSTRSEPSKTE
jgi:hypothetical protein